MNNKDIIKFIKYFFSAGSSFVLDVVLFTLCNYLLSFFIGAISIIVSTVVARILSSLYNYYINSRIVFGEYNEKSIYKYYVLVAVQMLVSALLVYSLNCIFVNLSDTLIKIPVDIVLFIINYIVQNKMIFINNTKNL